MPEKFYLDTSIWLDVYERRGKNGEFAMKFLSMVIEEDYILLYSEPIIRELRKLGYMAEEMKSIFNFAKPSQTRKINLTKIQLDEARKIADQRNVPRRDVLHAILARDNEAQLITRDKHFEQLKDITIAKMPEELI